MKKLSSHEMFMFTLKVKFQRNNVETSLYLRIFIYFALFEWVCLGTEQDQARPSFIQSQLLRHTFYTFLSLFVIYLKLHDFLVVFFFQRNFPCSRIQHSHQTYLWHAVYRSLWNGWGTTSTQVSTCKSGPRLCQCCE